MYYFAQVIAPVGAAPSNVNVNITVNGSLFSMAGPPFGSYSRDRLRITAITILDRDSNAGDENGAFSTSATISMPTGTPFVIDMFVRAFTQASSVSATTFLDPYLFLDPSLVAAGYSIVTSPGIGNSLAAETPIPAALPLFATGLGALGLLGWRRRKGATR